MIHWNETISQTGEIVYNKSKKTSIIFTQNISVASKIDGQIQMVYMSSSGKSKEKPATTRPLNRRSPQ